MSYLNKTNARTLEEQVLQNQQDIINLRNNSIQGVQGIQGIQGPQGPQGVTGPQGPQGVQGPQGIQGPQGLNGTEVAGFKLESYDESGNQVINLTSGNFLSPKKFIISIDKYYVPNGGDTTGVVKCLQLYNNAIANTNLISEAGILTIAYNNQTTRQWELSFISDTGAAANITQSSSVTMQLRTAKNGTYYYPTLAFTLTEIIQGTTVGPQGNPGPQGEIGPQGDIGPAGPQGVQGIQGPQGIQGEKGPAGAQGIQGATGTPGATPYIGGNGDWIIDGVDTGTPAAGTQGPQGIQGIQGATGPRGPQGAPGAIGPQGVQGIQGPQGIKGDKGDTGLDGKSFIITGYVATAVELPTAGASNAGEAYAVGSINPRDIYVSVWDGTEYSWVNMGPLEGPAGPQGTQGIQGPVGQQGPQGIQGPVGATGPQGDTGATGTITVGTVTASAPGSTPSVVNAGTPTAAKFNFVLPRGETGPQGVKGDPGGSNFKVIGVFQHNQTFYASQFAGLSFVRVEIIRTESDGGADPRQVTLASTTKDIRTYETASNYIRCVYFDYDDPVNNKVRVTLEQDYTNPVVGVSVVQYGFTSSQPFYAKVYGLY